jgi:hypothetical protein
MLACHFSWLSLPGLTEAIQYPQAGGYWIARSSRAMT